MRWLALSLVLLARLAAQPTGPIRPYNPAPPTPGPNPFVQRGPAFGTNSVAVIDGSGFIDGVVGVASNCVHVDGSNAPCGGGVTSGTGASIVGAEVPSGLINGSNQVFSLAGFPNPSAALLLAMNGVLLTQGIDYTLNSNTITFINGVTPQTGYILEAWYPAAGGAGPAFNASETPTGVVNGSNKTFSLAAAPVPPASLILIENGLVLRQNLDYTLVGNVVTFVTAPVTGMALRAWYCTGGVTNSLSGSEIPAGNADGSNTVFTLTAAPSPSSTLILTVDGVIQRQGADYTLVGSTISFTNGVVPPAGSVLQAWYSLAGGSASTLGYTPQNIAGKDVANGYAGLDSAAHLKTVEFPGSIPSNSATATALAAAPSECPSGQAPRGVDVSGNALGCQSVAAGSSLMTVDLAGTLVGTRQAVNLTSGTALTWSAVDNPGSNRVDITANYNTAVLPSHAQIHANEVFCDSSTGITAYSCSLTRDGTVLANYVRGMVFLLAVDTTCASTCTLTIDGLGTISIKQADGSTAPNGTLIAGQARWVWFDGTNFRLI